ncbi:uncharacterized protein BX664DRAFT_389184 [Halteromyces radiatus]|uniref:uncharacterized protein n=1 Tax=Halteromyces radiatus TaxID=101107 RepID=UPI0022202FE0|nr:uncharacterized protein BX664DRAFT_389184 [Halteromyces radiatus]KAI8078806.1 hypothetical protein BX664DRAFT_389184 [Halteromyces radiatus]
MHFVSDKKKNGVFDSMSAFKDSSSSSTPYTRINTVRSKRLEELMQFLIEEVIVTPLLVILYFLQQKANKFNLVNANMLLIVPLVTVLIIDTSTLAHDAARVAGCRLYNKGDANI